MIEVSGKLHNGIKKVCIVYFTGTGGTKRAAECFERLLTGKGIDVKKTILDMQVSENVVLQSEKQAIDMLILLFPVFACDAPGPVYDWISSLPNVTGIPAAIISVSGGGEVFPNTACRVGCIKLLENKGYEVVYERMVVMPSNIFVGLNDHLAMRLLQVLPIRVEHCISQILAGVHRRTKPQISSSIMTAVVSKYEKKSVKKFGEYLQISNTCNGCGWCARSCPNKNIKIENGHPVFDKNCTACLRCFYGCPSNSLKLKIFKSFTVKEGYNLDELEKQMKGVELEPVEKYCKGIVMAGVRKYLFEDES